MMMRKIRVEDMDKRRLVVIEMALMFGVPVAMAAVSVSVAVGNFPDAALHAAFRLAVNNPPGDIHDTDLIGLRALPVGNRRISNLTGILSYTDLAQLLIRSWASAHYPAWS